jgi:hypothetical protein
MRRIRKNALAIDIGGMRFTGVNCLVNLGGSLSAQELYKKSSSWSAHLGSPSPSSALRKSNTIRQCGDWRSQGGEKTQTGMSVLLSWDSRAVYFAFYLYVKIH